MTPAQKRTLQLYLHFRDRPMTFPGMLWANRRVYLMLLFAFGLIIVAVYQRVGPAPAGYFAVAMLVVLLRDCVFLWRTTQAWPAIRDVIDWNKLEAALNSTEGQSPHEA